MIRGVLAAVALALIAPASALAADPAITVKGGKTFYNGETGLAVAGTLATITDPDKAATAGEYSALISWGDGMSSAGTITGSGGNFMVQGGKHLYGGAGDLHETITIKVTDVDNPANSATATDTANQDVAPVANLAIGGNGTEGVPYSQQWDVYEGDWDGGGDTEGDAPPDLRARVNWGDGGELPVPASDWTRYEFGFKVSTPAHVYQESGAYTLTFTVVDGDGGTATGPATTVIVTDGAISGTGMPASVVVRSPLRQTLASFTTTDPDVSASDLSATINWKDGTTTAGTITAAGSGFAVSGTHTYAHTGIYPVQIEIADAGGASATVTSAVTVTARGHARLLGIPHACVRRARLTVRVRGALIKSVRFWLDGDHVRVHAVKPGRRYRARLRLSRGTHVLRVSIEYATGSNQVVAFTERRRVKRC